MSIQNKTYLAAVENLEKILFLILFVEIDGVKTDGTVTVKLIRWVQIEVLKKYSFTDQCETESRTINLQDLADNIFC